MVDSNPEEQRGEAGISDHSGSHWRETLEHLPEDF